MPIVLYFDKFVIKIFEFGLEFLYKLIVEYYHWVIFEGYIRG